ncbi:glycosyltransferase [Methanobacterium alkalithermotolerans]|uniref:Glycosyltransferase n=1 Tax=Methanobacterium alkalithermotolerans TaxID=2731220 RepID=A0A8T8K7J0_9EURY|nr:MJ1255/VC2487 family glycosyltransferase [Methanobacterium alkalithermotolerans]QUH22940.1 glycosyltransferase [Methanobacterium alkalithermotolerans]
MKVSIVIPTYNEEDYLPELLDSIKNQDFADYEIIISDANSRDNTRQIAQEYGCKIVDGGLPALGRNKGAKVAQGELILFLDSDLILSPSYLHNAVEEFEDKKLGIAISQMIPLSDKKRDKVLHEFANRFMIMVESIKPHGAGCYGIITRRSLHEEVNGFNESLDFGEDSDYIERIGRISKFKVLRKAHVLVSTRRLEKEGLKSLAMKYTKSTVYDFMGKKITAEELNYNFGYEEEVSDKLNSENIASSANSPVNNGKKRVIYSVCGEGMGHAIRSGVLLEELNSHYDLMIFASDRAYHYLSKKFDNVYEIYGFNTVYEDNRVKNKKTFVRSMKSLPRDLKENLKLLYKIARDFKPHVIVSDFEFYASLLSNVLRIPLISIDNMHIITQGKIEYPSKFKKDKLKAEAVVRSFIVRPERFIIMSYFFPPLKNKKSVIYPPVLRKEIINLQPAYWDYILVYQTSTSNLKLIEVLKKTPYNFVIYGFDKAQKNENLHFKIFNENEFFNDLENSQAIISNGGFGLISEALYLKKPVYSIPVQGQFEQILNAVYLQKSGYGEFHEHISLESLQLFLENLSKYQENLSTYQGVGNEEIIKELTCSIERYSKEYK